MIHKSDLCYINQKTLTLDGNLRILIYKMHYDRLSHAIKENCGASISASSPETVSAQTGREGARKQLNSHSLQGRGMCKNISDSYKTKRLLMCVLSFKKFLMCNFSFVYLFSSV